MISKQQKSKVIKKFAKSDSDTGSSEAQIGILSWRIKEVSEHLTKYSKDKHSRRGLVNLVEKRRSFLKYLEKNDKQSFDKIVKMIKKS